MPGKVNPVLPEATLMVCAQVVGNDAAVTVAGASGSFELNVAMPVIARNVLESVRLLAACSRLLAERCVDGITADADRMRQYAESSPSVVTPLNKYVGYEAAAKIAKQALADGATIRETVDQARLRRAGGAHRATARRGARRRVDDAPVSNSDRRGPGAVRRRDQPRDPTRGVAARPVRASTRWTWSSPRSARRCRPHRAHARRPRGGLRHRRLRGPAGRGAARHRAAGRRPVAAVRRADPRARRPGQVQDVQHLLGRRALRRGRWRSGCSTTCRTSTAASPSSAGCCAPAAASWR